MITRVAEAGGRAFAAVALESYALTLYTYLHLRDADRIQRTLARHDRFDLAGLMNRAMWDGAALEEEQQRFLGGIGAAPTVEDEIARRRALAAQFEAAGGVAALKPVG